MVANSTLQTPQRSIIAKNYNVSHIPLISHQLVVSMHNIIHCMYGSKSAWLLLMVVYMEHFGILFSYIITCTLPPLLLMIRHKFLNLVTKSNSQLSVNSLYNSIEFKDIYKSKLFHIWMISSYKLHSYILKILMYIMILYTLHVVWMVTGLLGCESGIQLSSQLAILNIKITFKNLLMSKVGQCKDCT